MPGADTQLQLLLDRALAGDAAAHDALFDHAADRLLRLARKMFHAYPALRRWEQTDDVFQNAMLRLHRALMDDCPESAQHFFNLAAVMIRRTLLDLAKHHLGPHGDGANHHTDGDGEKVRGAADPGGEPHDLEGWSAFHAAVEGLPGDEREVIGLLFYEGLTQDEAATVLGVSPRTVKRRWQAARLALRAALAGGEP
ncbi:MAG: sigma-70 family RNA polymerase sigma factor [Bacteroidales bacterium]|nr:sigma-70 family RNA polymerase sigma factor [Bacteroidales bacterium]